MSTDIISRLRSRSRFIRALLRAITALEADVFAMASHVRIHHCIDFADLAKYLDLRPGHDPYTSIVERGDIESIVHNLRRHVLPQLFSYHEKRFVLLPCYYAEYQRSLVSRLAKAGLQLHSATINVLEEYKRQIRATLEASLLQSALPRITALVSALDTDSPESLDSQQIRQLAEAAEQEAVRLQRSLSRGIDAAWYQGRFESLMNRGCLLPVSTLQSRLDGFEYAQDQAYQDAKYELDTIRNQGQTANRTDALALSWISQLNAAAADEGQDRVHFASSATFMPIVTRRLEATHVFHGARTVEIRDTLYWTLFLIMSDQVGGADKLIDAKAAIEQLRGLLSRFDDNYRQVELAIIHRREAMFAPSQLRDLDEISERAYRKVEELVRPLEQRSSVASVAGSAFALPGLGMRTEDVQAAMDGLVREIRRVVSSPDLARTRAIARQLAEYLQQVLNAADGLSRHVLRASIQAVHWTSPAWVADDDTIEERHQQLLVQLAASGEAGIESTWESESQDVHEQVSLHGAMIVMAMLFVLKGQFEEASLQLSRIPERFADSAQVLVAHAVKNELVADYVTAESYIDRASRARGDNTLLVAYHRAWIRWKQMEWEDGVAETRALTAVHVLLRELKSGSQQQDELWAAAWILCGRVIVSSKHTHTERSVCEDVAGVLRRMPIERLTNSRRGDFMDGQRLDVIRALDLSH